jgi:hypothetical protein
MVTSAPPDRASARRPQFVLNVPAIYVLHGGSSFDGHHGYVLQPDHVVHMPKLSGAFGVRPGVGVFMKHLFAPVSGMALLDVEWSRHAAKGYNAGGVAYDREYSNLINASLELRAIWDTLRIKPFVALAPGYSWLRLPAGVTVVSPTSVGSVTWADITLRGVSIALSGGASYALHELLSVEASIGVRMQSYSASSAGSLSGLGLSPILSGALGLTLML